MVPYSVKIAFQSLLHERWINLLSMLTIAMGLLVMTLVVLFIFNVDLFTKKLPEKFSVVAYMKEGIPEADLQNILAALKKNRSVEKVRYISKTEAFRELRSTMRDADYILEGLDENPLSASIEIRLKREAVAPESVISFVSDVKKMPGVDDVQYGEKFLTSIHSIKMGVQTVGFALTAIMTAGIIFICYSTVKILFYRRKEEIETLKLLGATRGFIRAPFLVEGGIIGIIGAGMSLATILVFYQGIFKKLTVAAPLFTAVVFPPEVIIFLPAAGLFLGVTGALIAIGRIRF
ncbi:MAG: permease-like cell division protein FtsX [Thermodesulfovibrionales bacterium]